jgi:hypothetical protein
MKFFSLFCLLFLGLGMPQKHFVQYDAVDVKVVRSGNVIKVTLPFTISEGYHIQDASNTLDDVLPTKISFDDNRSYKIKEHTYSLVNYDIVVLDKVSHKVMSNLLEVTVTIVLKKGVSIGQNTLKGELFYQACDHMRCFFPRTLAFNVPLK